MEKTIVVFLTAALLTGAADVPMDIETGLWKTTTVAQGGPAMPKLSCRVKERPFSPFINLFPGPDTPGGHLMHGCQQTVVKATSSRLDVKIECNFRNSQTTYRAAAEAQDAEHVKGGVEVRTEINHRARETRSTLKAEWLSDDCGDVKPEP